MSKTKKLTRLRRSNSFTLCAYCGHSTPKLPKMVPDARAIFEHMISCEKRPEAALVNRMLRLESALKYARAAAEALLVDASDQEIRSGCKQFLIDTEVLVQR